MIQEKMRENDKQAKVICHTSIYEYNNMNIFCMDPPIWQAAILKWVHLTLNTKLFEVHHFKNY